MSNPTNTPNLFSLLADLFLEAESLFSACRAPKGWRVSFHSSVEDRSAAIHAEAPDGKAYVVWEWKGFTERDFMGVTFVGHVYRSGADLEVPDAVCEAYRSVLRFLDDGGEKAAKQAALEAIV